jgi:hypothetical protein
MPKYDKYRSLKKSSGKRIPPAKIVAWIERNFEYKTRKEGAEYQICDPFDYDTKFRFNINPEYGVCNSWHGNEWAGPINPETGKRNCSFLRFVKIYKKCSFKEALEEVLGATGDVSEYLRPENRSTDPEVKRKVTVALPEGASLLAPAEDRQAIILKKWLKSRGYTEETIAKHELYSSGMDVYWPYFEFEMLVYWQSRSKISKIFRFPDVSVYDKEGNIVGETEGSKGDFLYGFDDVDPASYIAITEAIFDQYTIGGQTLATGGAILTTQQLKKIKLLGPRKGIILTPDNDVAGLKSLLVNNKLLERQGFKISYSLPPSIPYEKEGKKLFTKDWNELFTGPGMSLADIRSKFANGIKPLTVQETVKIRKKIREMDKSRR